MVARPCGFPNQMTEMTMRIPTIFAAIALTALLAACDEEGEDEGEEDAIEQSVDGEGENGEDDDDEDD
jgi:hypothetical protein